jgi:uncharacterized protein
MVAVCNKRRREDDHLSFIAGMGNMQIKEVNKWGVTTLESMAVLAIPLALKPDRGNVQTFEKLSHQARLQHQWRKINRPVFEILPLQEDLGFYKLPEPSDHDIFFDFEGDPYVGDTVWNIYSDGIIVMSIMICGPIMMWKSYRHWRNSWIP